VSRLWSAVGQENMRARENANLLTITLSYWRMNVMRKNVFLALLPSMFVLILPTMAGAQSDQTVSSSSANTVASSQEQTEKQEMRDELRALRAEVERLRAEVENRDRNPTTSTSAASDHGDLASVGTGTSTPSVAPARPRPTNRSWPASTCCASAAATRLSAH